MQEAASWGLDWDIAILAYDPRTPGSYEHHEDRAFRDVFMDHLGLEAMNGIHAVASRPPDK